MRLRKALLAAGLALIACTCAAEDAADGGFRTFWAGFRRAVVAGDATEVAALTHFPLEVRGPDDGDPVERYDRAGFAAIWKRLLAQTVYVPSNGQVIAKTMADVVAEKKEIAPADRLTDDSARVQQFEFRRIDGQWRLARAYLEE